MPWLDMEFDGKHTTVHINFGPKRNREFKHCVFCLREGRRSIGGKLCDFQLNPQAVSHKRTCDAAMCEKHATSVGPDRDLCPDHNTQSALFESGESLQSSDSDESDVATMTMAALVAAGETMSNWKYKTDGELRAAGYELKNCGRCSGDTCGAQIEWWKTPQGNSIPLDEGTLQPHWSTCPDAKKFHTGGIVKAEPGRLIDAHTCNHPAPIATSGYATYSLPDDELPSCTTCGSITWESECCPKADQSIPFRCCMPACQEKTPQQRPSDVNVPMCSTHWQRVPAGLKKTILALANGRKPQLLRAAIAAAVKEATR